MLVFWTGLRRKHRYGGELSIVELSREISANSVELASKENRRIVYSRILIFCLHTAGLMDTFVV